jgi:hypothetical protein
LTQSNGTGGTRGTVGTGLLCHDLSELIESDPATAWTWGDREGPEASPPVSSMAPVTPCDFHKPPEKTFATLKTCEASQ